MLGHGQRQQCFFSVKQSVPNIEVIKKCHKYFFSSLLLSTKKFYPSDFWHTFFEIPKLYNKCGDLNINRVVGNHPQIREQMSDPILHVFTLKFLAH